jgi:hypothetical protein
MTDKHSFDSGNSRGFQNSPRPGTKTKYIFFIILHCDNSNSVGYFENTNESCDTLYSIICQFNLVKSFLAFPLC